MKYSECVSAAIAIQHAKRIRGIMLSTVACLTLQYFSKTLFRKEKKIPGYKMSILIQ